ncbi:MAG: hypothetical protein Q9M13_02120, partial [Mariprofundales bacterium]|nr:hypothetical protein [Mariprofundales bacterium]
MPHYWTDKTRATAADTSGVAAKKAAAEKVKIYGIPCADQGLQFIPAAVETGGRAHADFVRWAGDVQTTA